MFVLASASAPVHMVALVMRAKSLIMQDLLTEVIPYILGILSVLVAYLFWRNSNSAEENSFEDTNESKYMYSVWLSFNLVITLLIL